jgi:hypothetical protein
VPVPYPLPRRAVLWTEGVASRWARLVKRGAHTLTKGQYQVLVVSPGCFLTGSNPARELRPMSVSV